MQTGQADRSHRPEELSPLPRGGALPTKIDKYGWAMTDRPGRFTNIDKGLLLLDHAYQREWSENRSLDIARGWSWVACGVFLVARRGDQFYVIDGQHRLRAALARADITELPCMVFDLSGPEAEAMAFWFANVKRKPPSVYARLHALQTGKDTDTTAMVSLIKEAGYEPSADERKFGIRCIAKFQGLWKIDRPLLERTWPLIATCHHSLCIRETMLGGLFYIQRNADRDITEPRWFRRIVDIGAERMHEAARRSALHFNKGGDKIYAIGLLEIINKGLRDRLALKEQSA